MQRLPAHEATIRPRQKHTARPNLRRLTWPSHRGLVELFQVLLTHGRDDEGRPDRSWSDGVDTNTLANELVRESAGERDDCAFRRGVIEEIGSTDVLVYR